MLRALVLCLILVATADAEPHLHVGGGRMSLLSFMGKAKRFIKDLNLLPSVSDRPSPSNAPVSEPGLFERPLHLPIKGNPGSSISKEDFTHHAGYFQLKGTHASKSVMWLG